MDKSSNDSEIAEDFLICNELALASTQALTPTLTSPFTINLANLPKPDHYTLLPRGTPS